MFRLIFAARLSNRPRHASIRTRPRRSRLGWLVPLLLAPCAAVGDVPGELRSELHSRDVVGKTFVACDSLNCAIDDREDAHVCLEGLSWPAAPFEVACQPPQSWRYDCLLRFPSAFSTGNAQNDRVACEWHFARDAQNRTIRAPAVVVVHESGRDMTVGRIFAYALSRQGLHAVLVQLPGYGLRRSEKKGPPQAAALITLLRQAVADVRRARDAVTVLPSVDAAHVTLQGTSLGGFVGATTAGLDRGFDAVFLMLAGGDLFSILQTGQRDAQKLRQQLQQEGYADQRLRDLVYRIEPLRLAHRLDPQTTWLFSGQHDDVVPLKNAQLLADAARLDDQHHVVLAADHYSGVARIPEMIARMCQEIGKMREGR